MNNDKYIALLKQYQAGSISDSDRHILERAALDDPFLFDAIEGYAVHGSSADSQAINILKNPKGKTKGKVRWLNMRSFTIAASLVALLTITFLVKNQLNDSQYAKETVAVASKSAADENIPMAQTMSEDLANGNSMNLEDTEETIEEEVQITEEPEVKTTKKVTGNNTNIKKEKIVPQVQSPPPTITKDKKIELKESPNSPKVEDLEIMDEVNIAKSEVMDEGIEITSAEKVRGVKNKRSSKPEGDAITYAETDGKGEYILGKVFDADGNHLIGVSVYIENTDIGSVTDFDGNFKLPKYGSGYQMVFNYTGYQQQKVIIGDLDFYQIIMPLTDTELSEIKISRPIEVDRNKAFPVMGMEDFEVYVSENKKYPLEVFGTTKSGTFKVSFNVNTDGSLSNFVDESENCDECFKEAVRLLKASGKWETIPGGQTYRTSYLFEF